jgi:hypothetical protein
MHYSIRTLHTLRYLYRLNLVGGLIHLASLEDLKAEQESLDTSGIELLGFAG